MIVWRTLTLALAYVWEASYIFNKVGKKEPKSSDDLKENRKLADSMCCPLIDELFLKFSHVMVIPKKNVLGVYLM